MVRTAVILAAVIGFAAPLAALQADRERATEVITIEVAPQDLDRCRETLAQVLAPQTGQADLQQVDAAALPTAVCVVHET
ncbi:hypothetical protein JYP51_10320 [Ponticoccus gilvus]|nr:hypothetical protein [Enemella evansiae]